MLYLQSYFVLENNTIVYVFECIDRVEVQVHIQIDL